MTDDEIMEIANKNILLALESREKGGEIEGAAGQGFVDALAKAMLATVKECIAEIERFPLNHP